MEANSTNRLAKIALWVTLAFLSAAPAAADLKLAVVASPDPVKPGGLVTYRLTATNQGTTTVSNVTLRSVVPDGLPASNSVAVVSDGGSCGGSCFAGRIVDWSIGSLAAGASRTVAMTAFVSSSLTDGTEISTSASVAGDTGKGDQAVASVVVGSSPLLTVAIRNDRDPVGAGELLRYTLTFGNPSTMVLSNVTLTAQLPIGAAFQSASDDGTGDGGSVTWALGSVPGGQSGQRQFTVEVPTGAVDGDILVSDAAIHDASTGGSARATSATTVRTNGPMVLALSASPDPVPRGSLLTFRLTVTNRGASSLSTVTLHSVVPDVLPASNSVAVVSDGGSCSGNCFAGHIVDWSLGSLAAGASRTVAMTAFVSSDTTRFPNSTLITNRAWVLGDGGAVAEQTVAVDASPLLAVAIRSDRDPVGAGELLRYTLTFGNPSTMVLSNVTLTAQLPIGAALQSASDQGSADGGSVTWALGSVPGGQSGQRQFTVEVPTGAVDGDILVSDAAIHDASTGGSARATSATTVRTNGPMALALSASPDPVRRGGTLSYSLTVMNLEASPLTTVTLHSVVPDVLPASNSVAVVSDGGSCSGNCFAGHIVDWSLGSLAAGASRTVQMTVTVSSAATRFPDGTLVFNRAWMLGDGGAAAEITTRMCSAGGTACDFHTPTPTFTPTATATVTPTPTPAPTTIPCVGDCDGSGDVTVNELIIMVNIALGNSPISACTAGDADGSGDITINEIIAAVNKALNGC